jgi:hypothetical protein
MTRPFQLFSSAICCHPYNKEEKNCATAKPSSKAPFFGNLNEIFEQINGKVSYDNLDDGCSISGYIFYIFHSMKEVGGRRHHEATNLTAQQ